MVTVANESRLGTEGVASNAFEGMPPSAVDGMPDAIGSAPPSGFNADASAATVASPVDPDADLRASIRGEIESSIRAEEKTTRERDISNLRRTLETQNTALRNQLQQSGLKEQAQKQWFRSYLQEVVEGKREPDPRDFAVFENEMRGAVEQQQAQVIQAQQAYASWAKPSMQRMDAHVAEQAVDTATGQQLFDANDPDIKQAGQAIYAWGARAALAPEGSQERLVAEEQNRIAYERHRQLVAQKREQGLRNLTGQRKVDEARQLQEVRSDQRARGVQPITMGGSGAAPPDFANLLEQAQKELPSASFGEQYDRALVLKNRALRS